MLYIKIFNVKTIAPQEAPTRDRQGLSIRAGHARQKEEPLQHLQLKQLNHEHHSENDNARQSHDALNHGQRFQGEQCQ